MELRAGSSNALGGSTIFTPKRSIPTPMKPEIMLHRRIRRNQAAAKRRKRP